MLEMYSKSLLAAGALTPGLPRIFTAVQQVVPATIDDKMRGLMTSHELITFAGHLRKNIDWHGTSIPINSISILMGSSGTGKNMAIGSLKKALKPALTVVELNRVQQAKLLAVEAAEDDGKTPDKWRNYYSKPRDLTVAISTLPGWIKHLNGLEAGSLGAGTLYVDELSSELATSKDLMELLTSLAILYDTGHLPVKALKSDDNQGEAVDNLPVSGLLFGSPHVMIYNEQVKKKFLDEASSKLARRAIFCFSNEEYTPPTYDSILASRDADRAEVTRIRETTEELSEWFESLVYSTTHDDLTVHTDVEDLYSDYKNYNELLAADKSMLHQLARIHRQHRQWAALKVAGALAILENESELGVKHYIEAINFIEMYVNDLEQFEVELAKEPYELFVSYMQSIAESGYASISIHNLRKLGFVRGRSSPRNSMLELIDLARSYDNVNRYELVEGYIHMYEGVEMVEDREEI